jgi:Fur family transcriptional regulator, ferric uptake regulator
MDEITFLTQLRNSGARMTKTRIAMVKILTKTPSPLSAIELIELLKAKGLAVNKTTVYRELDFLLERSLIREIDLLDGLKRYEVLDANRHHHHIVCVSCKKIICVDMDHDLDAIERRISRQHKFRITSHVLEFFGHCSGCPVD